MDKNTNQLARGVPFPVTHIKKLDKGQQGITGLVRIEGKTYVYKLSQYMNYLPTHEYMLMRGLGDLSGFCPHFCKAFRHAIYPIHPNFSSTKQDPFAESTKPVMMEVLFMEYIEGSLPLLDLIEDPRVPLKAVLSCLKQVILTLVVAQEKKRFAHYDLHSMNILIREGSPDAVHLYIVNGRSYLVPTHGYVPVIIDFGFAYSDDILGYPSYLSSAYTDAGYMSPAFDPIADAKVLLVSVAEDFRQSKRDTQSKRAHKFCNIVTNLFHPLHIDWMTGWDTLREESIVDTLFEYIENDTEVSLLFRDYSHLCMDILNSLIVLPLKPPSHVKGSLRQLRKAYQVIVHEFTKVEEEISNLFYTLYIFRQMVDIARGIRTIYMDPTTREKAVGYFQAELFTRVNAVARFCSLKTFKFEKILCALYVFQEQLQYQLHYQLHELMMEKEHDYDKLDVTNIEMMFAIIDVNLPDKYTFNAGTEVTIFDADDEQACTIELGIVDMERINRSPGLNRADVLHRIYAGHNVDEEVEVEQEESQSESAESEEVDVEEESQSEDVEVEHEEESESAESEEVDVEEESQSEDVEVEPEEVEHEEESEAAESEEVDVEEESEDVEVEPEEENQSEEVEVEHEEESEAERECDGELSQKEGIPPATKPIDQQPLPQNDHIISH